MKATHVALLTAVLLVARTELGESQNGITVTPPNNQTVPFGSDTNTTYECTVSDNRVARWEIQNVQVTPGSMVAQNLRSSGIFVEARDGVNATTLTLTRFARESRFMNSDIQLKCGALTESTVDIEFGDVLFVRTFFAPSVPQNLVFDPFPGNLSRLVLEWDQPSNTLIDSGDPVVTTYTVTVSGPTFNFTADTTDTRYEIVDNPDDPCAEHTFSVHASNDAGAGIPTQLNVTIPISPGIVMLNNSLEVSSISLSSAVDVQVTFLSAMTCNQTMFPILRYEVTVSDGEQSDTATFPVTDQRVADQSPITLPVPGSILEQDRDYYVTVSACIDVTCRSSSPVKFRTTDVQSASITFFENNVFLECSFANTIAGQGCVFLLSVASGVNETLMVPSSAGASAQCTQTMNTESAYTSIVALDWNTDGTFGTTPVQVMVNQEMIETVEEYTAMTGCVPPSTGLSPGAIAGVVIGVIISVLLILAVAIVIAFVVYRQRTSRLPKIQRHDEDKFFVDFEKQWLMDDTPAKKKFGSKKGSSKVSTREGQFSVDGEATEEPTSYTYKDFPSITSQPSLTDPEPAITLHIDENTDRARLHLNRSLIKRVLKAQSMTTLEKKRRAASARTPNESLRQLLLPLHSLVHVSGPEGTAEERGETL